MKPEKIIIYHNNKALEIPGYMISRFNSSFLGHAELTGYESELDNKIVNFAVELDIGFLNTTEDDSLENIRRELNGVRLQQVTVCFNDEDERIFLFCADQVYSARFFSEGDELQLRIINVQLKEHYSELPKINTKFVMQQLKEVFNQKRKQEK